MKRSELLKILKAHGCYFASQGKKHEMWYSPITAHEFPVPRHPGKEMSDRTVGRIMKQSGIK